MDLAVFFRQLRYWAFHCTLNALPSLLIAVVLLNVWKIPSAMAAMLTAIASFILLYAILTSLPGWPRDPDHLLSRALRMGVGIRGWVSVVSVAVVSVCTPPLLMVTPDFWCGYFAAAFFDMGARQLGGSGRLIDSPHSAGFGEIFAVTMLEGFMLSFLILLISFFAILILQAKDRRKAFLSPDSNHPGGI